MNKRFLRAAIAVGVAGLAAGSIAVAPANAATVIQVRPADLIAPSDTADGGVMEFLAQGVHLKTTNTTGFARGRFLVGIPLSQATTVNYTWYGTTFAPGVKYYVDADADGKVDGELRGELIYGGQDVWLNQDAQDFPDSALPDNFFANAAPCTGGIPASGVTDPCGASGASKHGTLANWATRLQAASGKAPVLHSGGYSLTGAAGDGVLTQITYGPNQYVFTNTAKLVVTVTAKAAKSTVKTGSKIKVTGTAKPVGLNAKVQLQVKKNGTWKIKAEKALAADGSYKLKTKAPGKPGTVKLRVVVPETNSTAFAKSAKIKVKVVK